MPDILIEVGFRPKVVEIYAHIGGDDINGPVRCIRSESDEETMSHSIVEIAAASPHIRYNNLGIKAFTETGFIIEEYSAYINLLNVTYSYIAFG